MPDVSEETVTDVAVRYREFCIGFAKQLDELWHDLKGTNDMDLAELRRAREHIRLLVAIDPIKGAKALKDIREGRFITLEQARRELRAKTR